MGWPLNTDTMVFLRALATVRDNPFLWVALRRDLRRYRPAVVLAAWVGVLAIVTACALAVGRSCEPVLAPAPLDLGPGRFAFAVLLSVEFVLVVSITRRCRFDLAAAHKAQASDQHRLIPLTPVAYAGMQNTYPLAAGLVLILCALPLHALALTGGGGRIGEVVLGHVLLVAGCLTTDERRPTTSTRQTARIASPSRGGPSTAERVRFAALAVSALAWALLAQVLLVALLSVLAPAGGPGRAPEGTLVQLCLLPHLAVRAATQVSVFWGGTFPLWIPLLLAWLPSGALRARRFGRWSERESACARIYPWSLGGLRTVFALAMGCGYLWPWVTSGRLGSLGGGPASDPSQALRSLFGIVMVAWLGLMAGPQLQYSGHVWWGVLRHPMEAPEPAGRSTQVRREISWALDAAASVYVPFLAIIPGLWVSGMGVAGTGSLLPAVGVGAAALLARWSLGRVQRLRRGEPVGEWCTATWTAAGVVSLLAGAFAPAPFGRVLLGATPLGAATSLLPGIGRLTALPATGWSFFPDIPRPALAAALQLALACGALWIALQRPARERMAARREKAQERPIPPTAELFRRHAYLNRITTNPVALRICRSRRLGLSPRGDFLVTGVLSLAAWVLWAVCVLCVAFGADPGSLVGDAACYPGLLTIIGASVTFSAGMLAAGAAVAGELSSARATGVFTLTCLTPMPTSALFWGYIAGPAVAGLGLLAGFAPSVPLYFIGTGAYHGLVWAILGSAFAFMVYSGALVHALALLYSLPSPAALRRIAPGERRRWWGVGLVPAFALAGTIALACVALNAGPALWYAVGVIALGIPAYAYRLAWLRFRWMRENAIPDRPEAQEGGEGQTPFPA